MQDDSIKAHRVEVLGDDVQKYSSTSVSGGGGNVTTVNGVTYGQIKALETTIHHHVDQDIWVKDLTSGKEMQINVVNSSFPVRRGHILRVAYDKKSDRWERFVNETTGETSYGNGKVNPGAEKQYMKEASTAKFWAIGVSVPVINLLIGPALLFFILVSAPVKLYGAKIPGASSSAMFAILSGLGLFACGWAIGLWWGNAIHSFFLALVACVGLVFSFRHFTKSFQNLFHAAASMVKARSELLDQSVSTTSFK
jgi:hypothetical protein